MEHKNFTYSLKSRYNGTVYYICSHFRSASCPARLIVKPSGAIEEVNQHSCTRPTENVVEATEQMKEVLGSMVASDIAVARSRVWRAAVDYLHRKHGESASLRYMPRHTAVSFVKNVRKELTGGDVFRAIELEPTVFVRPQDKRPFMQFLTSFSEPSPSVQIVVVPSQTSFPTAAESSYRGRQFLFAECECGQSHY
ncbi:hypothetical protein PC129_g22076 [Phytophthora cactorum]|uniref:FLYWCH-type domain-containing protein n=1 Tax=Phytophthora cactorum TaxID=29920 RepID=A0A8T0Y4T8_9STRA|nr:hypothetical protein Pcac1_g20461 [Phytophthora cactorum]KAG2795486.1 hypothetical protein PC111_g22121 [Phytophthora cactorum]KAG2795868.1 hypothetical protein PC112_g22450 [Phytophthora cactorum]KAG2821782.1 hypothetical protein PC113_g22424 [Phytophthora cactorum]KAG2874733.1 hypothetical protein PC114_g25104 [Phytophthora cactorum]